MTLHIPNWVFSPQIIQSLILLIVAFWLAYAVRRISQIHRILQTLTIRHDDHARATHKSFVILAQGLGGLNNDPDDDTFLDVRRSENAKPWGAPTQGTSAADITRVKELSKQYSMPINDEPNEFDNDAGTESVDPRLIYPKPGPPLEVRIGGDPNIEV